MSVVVVVDELPAEVIEVVDDPCTVVVVDELPAEVVLAVERGDQGAPGAAPAPTVYTVAPVHILPGDYVSIIDLAVKADALIVMPGDDAQDHEYLIKWRDPAHLATITDPNGRTFDGAGYTTIDGALGWKGLVKSDDLNDWSVVR